MVLDLMHVDFFSLSDGNGFGKNAMIFGADMSSVHIDKRKDILIHDKSTIDGLDDITLTAEKKYSINFTEQQMKFCLLCFTMVRIVIYLLMVLKYFKVIDSKINTAPLCLGNTSKDFSDDSMTKTGLFNEKT